MKIFISDSGINDLERIKEFYEEKGVSNIGEKFITEIIAHIESLPSNPDIGRIVPEFNSSIIRELIHPPFRIVYLREKNAVHIVRVWRSERLLKLPDDNLLEK